MDQQERRRTRRTKKQGLDRIPASNSDIIMLPSTTWTIVNLPKLGTVSSNVDYLYFHCGVFPPQFRLNFMQRCLLMSFARSNEAAD